MCSLDVADSKGVPMPLRRFSRDQQYLLPPALDEWVPPEHPIRYVAAFVAQLTEPDWQRMGIDVAGEVRGAPAYQPTLLISLWLAGFMQGIRSSRALEAACRDQVSFRWLSGNQVPDHNTLARFWQRHRVGMGQLVQLTVRTAVQAGLVDLALVAVDGTKVAGNASGTRTLDETQLRKLLARTEQAIAELEAQTIGSEAETGPLSLPKELERAQALEAQVRAALATVQAEDGPARLNLTDPDATSQKTRTGYVTGYNAQAAAARVPVPGAGPAGLLLTAATVTTERDDHAQLLPMLEASHAALECAPAVVVADGGYYSGTNLTACAERGQAVVVPATRNGRGPEDPYHRDAFVYAAQSDTFTCPAGQTLRHIGLKRRPGRDPARLYGGIAASCRGCDAFGVCTTSTQHGRTLSLHPQEAVVQAHRAWLATEAAQAALAQRKTLIEPAFGILKEVQRLPRFLLRGVTNVTAEWQLLAASFNLRTLARLWAAGCLDDGPATPDGSDSAARGAAHAAARTTTAETGEPRWTRWLAPLLGRRRLVPSRF
jgi:transposase